jgi:hypothetical protein
MISIGILTTITEMWRIAAEIRMSQLCHASIRSEPTGSRMWAVAYVGFNFKGFGKINGKSKGKRRYIIT